MTKMLGHARGAAGDGRRLIQIISIGCAALAVSACTTTPSDTRMIKAPVARFEAKSFDALTSCVSETGITNRFQMKYLPTADGHAWHYDHGGPAFGGRSTIMIEVRRGPPAVAEVTVTGGPWLGTDKKLIRAVQKCAAKS
jgi:hypothetical protein